MIVAAPECTFIGRKRVGTRHQGGSRFAEILPPLRDFSRTPPTGIPFRKLFFRTFPKSNTS
jgi:hypothetical protein